MKRRRLFRTILTAGACALWIFAPAPLAAKNCRRDRLDCLPRLIRHLRFLSAGALGRRADGALRQAYQIGTGRVALEGLAPVFRTDGGHCSALVDSPSVCRKTWC